MSGTQRDHSSRAEEGKRTFANTLKQTTYYVTRSAFGTGNTARMCGRFKNSTAPITLKELRIDFLHGIFSCRPARITPTNRFRLHADRIFQLRVNDVVKIPRIRLGRRIAFVFALKDHHWSCGEQSRCYKCAHLA